MRFPKAALTALGLIGAVVVGWVAVVFVGVQRQGRPVDGPVSKTALTAAAANLEYVPTPIGASLSEFDRPMVTNVSVIDLETYQVVGRLTAGKEPDGLAGRFSR